MEKIISALEEVQKINNAYGLSCDDITALQSEIETAKVCTPIIGRFSSGKSALINTILGYSKKILKENIIPETAVPAEIVYSDSSDSVTVVRNGEQKILSVDDYRNYEIDAKTVNYVKISLRNSFLKQIPDVMIVDMPGFESGYDVHNKAIDNYLPQSLAYIVAFPADDMIVRSSIGNILKELCLHDMPLCVVITKYDKRNDDFETTFENMKKNLKRFVGDREIKYCTTSNFTGDAQELEEFLKEIQCQSQNVLARKFKAPVISIIENTENYLKTTLNGSWLSESELSEQEEKLKKQLSALDTKFSRQQTDFDSEARESIEEIKNDVQCAMENETSIFVAMAMNRQSINEQLNNTVRTAITVSIKKRFIPRMEKYLKKVSNTINGESLGDVHISFNFDTEQLSKGITSTIVALVAGTLLGGPIIGIIAGIAMKLFDDKKREQVKEQITIKLQSEVYPQVLREVGNNIENGIIKHITLVNTSIEDELKNQKATLEKAMADLRDKINSEKACKENIVIDINSDLEKLGEIKNDL